MNLDQFCTGKTENWGEKPLKSYYYWMSKMKKITAAKTSLRLRCSTVSSSRWGTIIKQWCDKFPFRMEVPKWLDRLERGILCGEAGDCAIDIWWWYRHFITWQFSGSMPFSFMYVSYIISPPFCQQYCGTYFLSYECDWASIGLKTLVSPLWYVCKVNSYVWLISQC